MNQRIEDEERGRTLYETLRSVSDCIMLTFTLSQCHITQYKLLDSKKMGKIFYQTGWWYLRLLPPLYFDFLTFMFSLYLISYLLTTQSTHDVRSTLKPRHFWLRNVVSTLKQRLKRGNSREKWNLIYEAWFYWNSRKIYRWQLLS